MTNAQIELLMFLSVMVHVTVDPIQQDILKGLVFAVQEEQRAQRPSWAVQQ